MGSPPTALDSLAHLSARETRVRRLPPAYSLTTTSLSLRGVRQSIFGTAGYAGSPNPKGGRWRRTQIKQEKSLRRASSWRWVAFYPHFPHSHHLEFGPWRPKHRSQSNLYNNNNNRRRCLGRWIERRRQKEG